MRSGRKGRGFESRRLDHEYGVTIRLRRIFFVFLKARLGVFA